MNAAIVLTIAWGVLAFGGVYPWAYWPLFAMAAAIGLTGLVRGPQKLPRLVAAGACAVTIATALQLVPIPRSWLSELSPRGDRLLRELDISYAAGIDGAHPLSIDPRSTAIALAAVISLAFFTLGLSRLLTARRARTLGHAIVALGACVAFAGIVQKSTGTPRIYGVWTPYDKPFQIFGPFVNKNHFSGWMIMALGVGIGVLNGRLTTAMRGVRNDWRSRLLWLASGDASQILLVGAALVLMAFAIVSLAGMSAVIVQAAEHGRRRYGVITAVVIGVMIAGAGAWAGTQPVLARLQNEPAFEGRIDAWKSAVRIARDFPAAGTGLNTFSTAMLFYQPATLTPRWEFAHNVYLQLAAEGGWLLMTPMAVTLVFAAAVMFRELRRTQPAELLWLRLGAVFGLFGIACQAAVDFSLYLPGIALLFAALAAVTISGQAPTDVR